MGEGKKSPTFKIVAPPLTTEQKTGTTDWTLAVTVHVKCLEWSDVPSLVHLGHTTLMIFRVSSSQKWKAFVVSLLSTLHGKGFDEVGSTVSPVHPRIVNDDDVQQSVSS